MKTSNCTTNFATLCFVGLLVAASFDTAGQTPGTLTYYAEVEISKERLLPLGHYELAKSMLPTQYQARADFYIDLVRSGHQYEHQIKVLPFRPSGPRATNVCLAFPDGRTNCAMRTPEGFVFPGWTNSYYTFDDLKAALPPGPYTIVAYFPDGAGTNYTAQLPDYSDNRFPQFVPGVLTWTGTSNARLVLEWDTIPNMDEYEVWAGVFPIGTEVYYSDNIFPTYPDKVTNVLSGTEVSTNLYSVYIQAERDVDSGNFHFEFSSYTDFHFLPSRLANPERAAGAPFQCDVLGGNGTSYLVQGSTNLTDWTPLGVGTVRSNGGFRFTDSASLTLPQRFYRALWSPAP